MLKQSVLLSGLLLGLALAACAPAATPAKAPEAMMEKSPEPMMEKTPDAMMREIPGATMKETPDAMWEPMNSTMMDEEAESMMGKRLVQRGAHQRATGDSQDAGLQGQGAVETMAMWCPTCLRQQQEVKALHDQLGKRDDFVSVGIGVDLNEKPADLKAYTAKNGFDWTYTVATPEVAREIGNCTASSSSIHRLRRCSSSIGTAVTPLPFGEERRSAEGAGNRS
jgi:hypothetical protein